MKMQIDMKKVLTIDKLYHILVEFIITFSITGFLTYIGCKPAIYIASTFGITVGIAKEKADANNGGVFDVYDLIADIVGICIGCSVGYFVGSI
jgi:uncharacterized membrane protein YccC